MTDAAQNVQPSEIRVARAPTRVSASMSRQSVERLMNIISPVALIGIWEICAQLGLIDVRFFPPPSKIFKVMYTMIGNGLLEKHVWASMQRLFWGILWGGIPALILGVAMGMFRTLRMIVEPIIAATYPIPKSAILPLILPFEQVQALAAQAEHGGEFALDVAAGTLVAPDGGVVRFTLPAFRRDMLLTGADQIALTLQTHTAAIDAWQQTQRAERPWAFPPRGQ